MSSDLSVPVMLFLSYSINRLTGTDGFPVLCHQFFPSSLSRREYCLTSSETFSLKMNKLREALLLFSSIGCMWMGYPHRNWVKATTSSPKRAEKTNFQHR